MIDRYSNWMIDSEGGPEVVSSDVYKYCTALSNIFLIKVTIYYLQSHRRSFSEIPYCCNLKGRLLTPSLTERFAIYSTEENASINVNVEAIQLFYLHVFFDNISI